MDASLVAIRVKKQKNGKLAEDEINLERQKFAADVKLLNLANWPAFVLKADV